MEVSSEVKDFIDTASPENIADIIIKLGKTDSVESINTLSQILCHRAGEPLDRHMIARLGTKALVAKGTDGLLALNTVLRQIDSPTYTSAILEALFYVSQGKNVPLTGMGVTKNEDSLEVVILPSMVQLAARTLSEFVADSHNTQNLFFRLIQFVHITFTPNYDSEKDIPEITQKIFSLFSESSIKISRQLIDDFEKLINENHSEEIYQRFLSRHPILIDPLADEVILKQNLGNEFITDFVVKRLDNEYLVVEIEKPQDKVFTNRNDFSSKFTHAFGQLLDFHEWIETHSEYARSLMPNISSPRGVLIMGRRNQLSHEQINKLKRFSINSRAIEIVTFDDLLTKAKILYRNIYKI